MATPLGGERPNAREDARAAQLTEELGAQLGRLKGAGPKIGQCLSMVRLDRATEGERSLPALGALPDGARAVPFGRVRRVIEQDLGARVGELFADVDEEPFALASLGQVHRARTSDVDDEEDSDNDVVMRAPITFFVNFPRKGKDARRRWRCRLCLHHLPRPDGSEVVSARGPAPTFLTSATKALLRGPGGPPGPRGTAGLGIADLESRVEEVAATADDAQSTADEGLVAADEALISAG